MAVDGFVESVSSYQLRGWAYSHEEPSLHLQIIAECSAEIIAKGTANVFREDLARASIAAGDHAFIINLDRPLSDENQANLKVYAIGESGARHRLNGLVLTKPEPQPHPPSTVASLKPPFEPVDKSQFPVFVLGAARSGTSALAQALVRSGWYEGQQEGHLFPLLPRLLRAVHVFYRENGEEALGSRATLLSRVPKAHFLWSARSLFTQLARQTYPTGRWLDKTPTLEMITVSPILSEMWPNAKFIFARRRAIENIASRMRKFPNATFSEHCTDWANIMNVWLGVREQLGSAGIEIEHLDLAHNPKSVSEVLSAMLGIPEDARVRFEQALSFDRPERTTSDFAELRDFNTIDWTEQQKEEFMKTCGPMMEKYRYTLGLDYLTRSAGSTDA